LETLSSKDGGRHERQDFILVVDDKVNNRLLLNTYLVSAGYQVQLTNSGEEALKIVVENQPHLIILDVLLPKMNGYEVCRTVKLSEKSRFIPVILVTALHGEEERMNGIEAGADDFIGRPINKLELLTRVKSLLRIRRLHEDLEQKILELERAKLQLQQLAVTDGLTGLYNYQYFKHKIQIEVSRSQRHGLPVSLLMMDIDFFKMYNDHFGHPLGDRILRRFSNLLFEHVRQIDILSRYGGEEFALILPGTSKENAKIVAEKLRTLIEKSYFPLSEKLPFGRVTMSVGVSCFPTDAKNEEELIHLADQALYSAKKEGRNRTVLA
jgi:two-component system cell cycle response regulator